MNISQDIPPRSSRIDLLQMLRGIAAIMVVMFHASAYQFGAARDNFASWLTSSGASGVDLFFCISGFVMTYTTCNPSSQSALDFVTKRVCRIAPAYILATIAFAFEMTEVQRMLGYHDALYHLTIRDVAKSLLFVPLNLTDAAAGPLWGTSTLHVGWTLNYEMYFYAVFAVSLLFKRLRWFAFFGWILLTLCCLPLIFRGTVALGAHHFYGWPLPYLNLMTSGMIWEFVAGVVIGLLYLRKWAFPNVETAWLATALSVTLVAWSMLNQVSPQFGPTGWGGSYMILLAVLLFADNTIHFRIPRALVWLGNVSFSLYLVHPFVVEGIGIVLPHATNMRPYLIGMPYVLVLTVLSICLAYPVHMWIEGRLSDAIRRKAQSSLLLSRGRVRVVSPGVI
jgi:exopolysaccharide production protein ExoZ